MPVILRVCFLSSGIIGFFQIMLLFFSDLMVAEESAYSVSQRGMVITGFIHIILSWGGFNKKKWSAILLSILPAAHYFVFLLDNSLPENRALVYIIESSMWWLFFMIYYYKFNAWSYFNE